MPTEDVPKSEAFVCVCGTCSGVLLYDGFSPSETGYWPDLVYPRTTSFPSSVPAAIREIYAEAALVKQNAPTAFTILIRKGLEAICDERGAPAGNLAARLAHLAKTGLIPPALAEVTDALRIVGNTAAHGSMQPVTTPMTWAIDGFFRAVIEYVFVAPSKLEEFRKRLAAAGKP